MTMHYIIDGHNLIPHIRGIELSDLDDEQALIDLLIRFARLSRAKLRVYFDQASPGQSGERRFGAVAAIFVPQSQTADTAIIAHLSKLGSRARNYSLVSSDRMVQAAARAAHMPVLSSQEFSTKIEQTLAQASHTETPPKTMSAEELLEWEALFAKGRTSGKNKP